MTANQADAVPIWPAFVRPILTYLASQQVAARSDIKSAVFDDLALSPEAVSSLMESGQPRSDNRCGWALTHLYKNGLIERPSRARYSITERGRQFLQDRPAGLTTFAEANEVFKEGWRIKDEAMSSPSGDSSEGAGTPTFATPDELMDSAYSGARREVEEELLARLRASDPDFFERAVVHVLIAMGYGGAERRGQRIGGTGDGGVDGVIDQDALGLDQIYIQAKRYAAGNNIGGDSIRAFIGAVQSRGASRGVFITTSSFTPAARNDAESSRYTRIVLVDGPRLASLMVKYRIGVQVRTTYSLYEVDEDFFE